MAAEPRRARYLGVVVEEAADGCEADMSLRVLSKHVVQRVARRTLQGLSEVPQDVLENVDMGPATRRPRQELHSLLNVFVREVVQGRCVACRGATAQVARLRLVVRGEEALVCRVEVLELRRGGAFTALLTPAVERKDAGEEAVSKAFVSQPPVFFDRDERQALLERGDEKAFTARAPVPIFTVDGDALEAA